MPIRIASHLYRNRHGGFYFRLRLPPDLRQYAGRHEVRLSLFTEERQVAIIAALPLIEHRHALLADLKQMADDNKHIPEDYFAKWREELFRRSALQAKVKLLEDEIAEKNAIMASMVTREKAKQVGKIMHEKGQLVGKKELENKLVFPWPPERTPPFSQLLEAYLRHFGHRAAGGRKKPLADKTLKTYRGEIGFFITVMTDLNIGAIDRDIAGQYFDILRKLPPNLNKVARYQGKSIGEILALGDDPQKESNASKKMERTSSMFAWALKEKRKWGIDANPFAGFGQAEEESSSRRPFTPDELRMLLSHQAYQKRHFRSRHAFWLIPLGTFTGARLGELCQLDIKDFVEVDGIPCIDINDADATEEQVIDGRRKHVKNKNAKRLVPIHPALIRMGLLEYVAELRAAGESPHLFPDLSRTHRDGPAHPASKWFAGFRNAAGLTEKQTTVFHSLRHLFITTILDAGTAPHMLAPVVGHEAELVTGKVYWDKRDATKRLQTVQTFALPDDILAMFPHYNEVTFTKKRGTKPSERTGNGSHRIK